MPTTLRPLYGAHAALSIGNLNSLASNASAGAAVVDNTADLADDALVSVTIASGTGTATTGVVTVYAYGDTDGTGGYTDGVTGTAAIQTLTNPTNLRPIGYGNVVANSTTYRVGPFSVANAFGGRLPRKWGIVVNNGTGGALAAAGNSADYVPVQYQGV